MEILHARYKGFCSGCGQPFAVGTPIAYDNPTRMAYHQNCAGKASERAALTIPCRVVVRSDAPQPGASFRDDRAGIVTVVRSRATYISAELAADMDWFEVEDGGYDVTLFCRPATDHEAAPILAREQQARDRTEAARSFRQLARLVKEAGERPVVDSIPGTRLAGEPTIMGGGEWFVVSDDWIWYCLGNGADGDDWSLSNAPSTIAWRVPWDEDLATELWRVHPLLTGRQSAATSEAITADILSGRIREG